MDASILGAVVVACLASVLEFVEAFTLVMAVAISRDRRSALVGVAGAVIALAVVTALVGGVLVRWLPEDLLHLIVGTLLLIFGLQWLRGAVVKLGRAGDHHAEADTVRERATGERRLRLDWFAFVVAFKSVLLEGIEVVFIVVTVGATAGSVPAAAIGAAAAGLLIVAVGLVARRAISRLPEDVMGFAVGVLLTAFGTFWAVEGLGVFARSREVDWPGGDWSLSGLLLVWAAYAYAAVHRLRRHVDERVDEPAVEA